MKSFELVNWAVARRGMSQVALAVVLSSAACSSGGDGDVNNNGLTGTGGGMASVLPGSGGTAAAVVPKTGGAAGMTPPGTGGKVAVVPPGTGGVTGSGGAPGTGGAMAVTDGGMPPPMGSGESACLDDITDYESDGPFTFKSMTVGQVKFWVPDVPPGCKVPVIHLANGTGASCASYGPALERMASHGFLTCCYENPNTGAGDQGVMAFDAAFMMFPDLAAKKLGSTGHSQGGQAAFTVLSLAEAKFGDSYIYAGLAMEPASGFGSQPSGGSWQSLYEKIKSPMFMFSAVGTDGLVSQGWVMDAFNNMNPATEVYFWAKNGATHIPVPNGEEQEISIPWFRWKLLGDQKACAFFKAIPMTIAGWEVAATQNEKPCM